MRTTVTIDDELLAKAREYSGVHEVPELVRQALKALVSMHAARRLAALGGSQPDFEAGPRKRPWLEGEDDAA